MQVYLICNIIERQRGGTPCNSEVIPLISNSSACVYVNVWPLMQRLRILRSEMCALEGRMCGSCGWECETMPHSSAFEQQ